MSQEPIFTRTQGLKDAVPSYCPGCGHGVAHRLVAEVLTEMNALERTVAVAPVGCAVYGYDYWNFDTTEAAHGRTPAVATALKRVMPDRLVMSYQGDGDLASIGMAEIIHAANRGEKITVIFINNTNYGMTGGQMAPTTLPGQITTTSPHGRDVDSVGAPMQMAEMLATLPGVVYSARGALHKPGMVRKAKTYIRKAFDAQEANLGFSIVELLSLCPTNWGMNTRQSLEQMETSIMKAFPMGVMKDDVAKEASADV